MSFKQESSVDPLDIDRYIDFDQAVYPSPSVSSSSSSHSKTIATPEFLIGSPNNTYVPSQLNTQSSFEFTGPSHQYDLHKQQTGLPVGSLANTLAVNQPNTFGFGGYQAGPLIPTDGFYSTNTADDFFNFNTIPSHNPSFSSSTDMDMDMDFDSPTSDLFTPLKLSSNGDFVDPNAISGQEDLSPLSTPVQSNAGKLWPGMHQQQAAMAKAQAQKRQQQQQQSKSVQPSMAAPQRQAAPKASSSSSRPAADPIVEERISRLLNQMRQNSVTSSHDDAMTPNANGGQSHLARQRKDEEDMDEDERLLASEEGKKLSSKERRQLRNKVSARAFRSRRKGTAFPHEAINQTHTNILLEYIGQLEGEIAAKVQEADELKADNEALKAENTRLTDLTRMLLSSPAFSSFLNDLSNTGNGLPAPAPAATPTRPSSSGILQTQPLRKDANPHQRQLPNQSQSRTQVGMTLVPDTSVDFSVFDPTSNAWGGNMDLGFNNAQVFSVTELPEGPSMDSINTGILSGKSSNIVGPYSSDEAKDDTPIIERMPSSSPKSDRMIASDVICEEDIELDASNPAFALFVDSPASAPKSQASESVSVEPEYRVFGGIDPEKAFARLDLVVHNEDQDNDGIVSSAVMARFERLCSETEAASSRVAILTAHL